MFRTRDGRSNQVECKASLAHEGPRAESGRVCKERGLDLIRGLMCGHRMWQQFSVKRCVMSLLKVANTIVDLTSR